MNKKTLLRYGAGPARGAGSMKDFLRILSSGFIHMHKLDIIPFPAMLAFLFVMIWIILAINPSYRTDWLLENLLVFAAAPFLVYCYKKRFFSNLSYTFIFIFLIFHIVGAHYTFSEVPVAARISGWFGWERNHYDRIVHFLFGALLTLPMYELLSHKIPVSTKWKLLFSLSLIFSLGAIYEIIEWLTAIIVSPEAGTAYLGTQGDQWDAQKDLSLKILGSLLAISFFALRIHNRKVP